MEDKSMPELTPIGLSRKNEAGTSEGPPETDKMDSSSSIQESLSLAEASYNASDIDSAILYLSFAAESAVVFRTKIYGEKSKEAIQPLFMYGSALLGRALLNDEYLSTMPKEQAMWFEAVTGYPKPDPLVAPKDISNLHITPKNLKQLPPEANQMSDIELAIEVLSDVVEIADEHDKLIKAVILKCLDVAEVLKSAKKDADPIQAKSNLKRAFEREFEEPEYAKKPRMDLA
ncbi:hypothetical protein FO519_000127 [Halicephalobus sp. NKZ332]|nr:hypothetical protein FO519_000127 [Halicephalobus sp. NKZ332]